MAANCSSDRSARSTPWTRAPMTALTGVTIGASLTPRVSHVPGTVRP